MAELIDERRREPRKRLANRLLVRVIAVSLLLLVVTLVATMWFAYPRAKQQVIADLQLMIDEKLKRNQQSLSLVELRGEQLADSFLQDYRAFSTDPSLLEYYADWFETTSPGVQRLQERFFTGERIDDSLFRGMSVFVGPQAKPITDEFRARLVIAVRVLNRLGPAWQSLVSNTHLSFPENALAIYSLDNPWGRLADKDLVMTDYATVKSTLLTENPERQANWTGLYRDLSADYWTITYQRPIDWQGQHLANASFDVSLEQLLQDLAKPITEQSFSYVLNESGHLIVSSRLDHKMYAQQPTLTPENVDDSLYQAIAERITQESFADAYQVWDDLDANYIFVAHYLGTPGWWYFTAYPKEDIVAEALELPVKIALVSSLLVFAVLMTLWYFVRQEVSQPLTRLARMARMLNEKNYQDIAQQSERQIRSHGEVRQVTNAFRVMARRFVKANNELEQRVQERTQALSEANCKLEELAHLDGLTGLMNRRALQNDLSAVLANPSTEDFFVMADIDDFKPYNDNYGHEAGDQVLIKLAELFKRLEQSHSYRYGGEEFAILLKASSHSVVVEQLQALRAQIHALAIEHNFRRHPGSVLSVSLGVTRVRPSDSAAELIQRADQNMYRGKQQGGDTVVADEV
ncbi:GGDEF domain-containing protein [Pseudidiomarina salilacus]|uniref:GGDEF domain-containing protein n=1 Tax=Pseudidiomarina salilacus TaxID=3384452 RepID=UPI003984F0CA